MRKSIKKRIEEYFKKSSWLKITGDTFFYMLIILLIIPVTRREIISTVKRITLMSPSVKETPAPGSLGENDYLFRFESMEGRVMTLSEFKGNVLFINFWATWCPPCRAEMPSVQRLYDEYGDKISFIMITGEDSEPVRRYMQNNNYSFPVYFQKSGLPASFDVSAIPHTYVINRKGEILMSKTGAAKWDSSDFKEYLDKLMDI